MHKEYILENESGGTQDEDHPIVAGRDAADGRRVQANRWRPCAAGARRPCPPGPCPIGRRLSPSEGALSIEGRGSLQSKVTGCARLG
ncbi:hypothetical protein CDAR_396011 [Caerostris darwini]|uniref:Uncharacterized protein n=1 Tax=Caerostris darwini TaxID=1538125 RepID=A0AAV4WQQ9_9ARAC|nr:hypothetical protein CDAR_396011 [Caerostris darwini]